MNAAKRDCSVVKRKRSPVFGMCAAIELLHERLDAGARLPRRLRQPAGEEHVVFGLELLELGFEPLQVAFDGGRRHRRYRGIRNQTSGSHSSRAYGTGRSSISTSVASEPPTI